MVNETWPLSNEERTKNILLDLDKLKDKFPDYINDIEDLIFDFEEKQLWYSKALQLRIWETVLRIRRSEKEDDLLKKLEDFLEALLKDEVEEVVDSTKQDSQDLTHIALAEWRKRTYWRDITPVIIKVKYAFEWEKLFDDMNVLREKIHNQTLWQQDFSITHWGLTLDIKQWDDSPTMLDKLAIFFKKLINSNTQKFEAIKTIDTSTKDFNKERKKARAVIFACFNDFRWKFKWSDFGLKIAELRDLINASLIWVQTWFKIKEDWISLNIKKWDHPDIVVEKILKFIEEIQKKNPKKFEEKELIDSKEVLTTMEEDKTYWRDIIAWIDILQRNYPAKDYPVLDKLKQMLEANKLWEWTNLFFNIWWVILEIDQTDSEKNIKSKISIFIWILKQIADQEEEKNKLDKVFWRDIEATLKSFEEVYWTNTDFQMLLMSIESWILWTVKDFTWDVQWVIINIYPSDSDSEIKQKLLKFIEWLKNQKKVVVNNQEIIEARKKIAELEKWMQELSDRYKDAIHKKDWKIWNLEKKVDIFEQENRKLKAQISSSSSSGSTRSRPVTRNW